MNLYRGLFENREGEIGRNRGERERFEIHSRGKRDDRKIIT